MLVLSRYIGQRIQIGDHIVLTVIEFCDEYDVVRIGIEAPLDVVVHRQEVYESIRREGRRKPPLTAKRKYFRRPAKKPCPLCCGASAGK
ncbi:MAG: carbon storage regulator [Planctomycetaceae bacterium]|nr:carbon storage regulator [Planctomycetaceae bacterium]